MHKRKPGMRVGGALILPAMQWASVASVWSEQGPHDVPEEKAEKGDAGDDGSGHGELTARLTAGA